MKKIFALIIAIIITILAAAAGQFYWNNLRGAGPAFKRPPANIADLVENQNSGKPPTSAPGNIPPAINNTSFPLKLPDGFSISIYAKNLGNPRVLAWGPNGLLLASIPQLGKVVALKDANGDGTAETILTVASGLNRPHGLATYCRETCKLYIAESNQVAVYDFENETSRATNKKKIVDLPDGGRHFTRTIIFMPSPNEDTLLISIGSSCDVCHETDPRRAAIYSVNFDGTDFKPFGTGLRNSVFMAIHPVTGDIWATEMGRDQLGDNLPPDEINIIREGKFYGWPICYGKNIHDDAFDKNTYIRNPCMEPMETPSHIDLQAHSAPLGLAFIPEEGWPQAWWHNLLVAYHGSWNRSEPTGYKIARFKLDQDGNYLGQEDFISGWLTKDGALGRPVDIIAQPGGTLYISDDKAGVVYRVKYSPGTSAPALSDPRIRLTVPAANSVVSSPLRIEGEARGTWYFEASFPVKLLDANGNVLVQHYAQAQSDWMTENFVPFESKLIFANPPTDTGTLVLEKDNPSGLPEYNASISIPVLFR